MVEDAEVVKENPEVVVDLETETSEVVMEVDEEPLVAEALTAVVEEVIALRTQEVAEEKIVAVVLLAIEEAVLQNRRTVIILSSVNLEMISLKMLSISQRALLADKIQEQIKRVGEDIVQLEEDTQPIAPENSLGRVSRMDAINNKSVAEESLRQARRRLVRLQEAAVNVTQLDFGNCQQCKETIVFDRLIFMPESRQCMQCAR